MIKVNLLPTDGAKGQKKRQIAAPKPSIVVVLILAIVYLAVGTEVYVVAKNRLGMFNEKKKKFDEKEKILKDIEDLEEQFEKLKEIKGLIYNQVEILRALKTSDRILWSEKINMLSAMIPENVYITKMKMKEKQEPIVTQESQEKIKEWETLPEDEKASIPKPEPIFKPLITQTIIIDGISRGGSPEECLVCIVDFQKAMNSYKETRRDGTVSKFRDIFDKIEMGDTYMSAVEDVEVRKFQFILTTQPLVSQ